MWWYFLVYFPKSERVGIKVQEQFAICISRKEIVIIFATKANREMDQVEIDVIQFQVFEGKFEKMFHFFRFVPRKGQLQN